MKRLPSLNALRAFAVAGQRLSFTKAADELNVTQAAVSHQIKSLEDHLGVRLFKRLNRALVLTDAGRTYLTHVSEAFDILTSATERMAEKDVDRLLTVSTLPSFAARWLVPRIGQFREHYPHIRLRIDPDSQITDFTREDVDVAIRYGNGRYPGLETRWLMTEDIFPVCSPALLNGGLPLKSATDLKHHTLLHDDGYLDWRTWLLAAGAEDVDPTRGTIFTDASMLLTAAAAGQGIALARQVLAADELKAGRLVRPFDLRLPVEFAYYLVYPKETAADPNVVAFARWLTEAVALDENK